MSAAASPTIHWRNARHHWEIYLFVLPTLLMIGLFCYYPALSGVFHSFFRWNGADISEFIGLDNYRDLLANSDFWQSFKIALVLGVCNVFKMIPALAVAVCIHRCRSTRMQFFYRTLFVVPMVIPGLVIALIWRSLFFDASNGYLNALLDSSGLMHVLARLDAALGWGGIFGAGRSPAWLGDPRLILVACVVWGFPWVGSFAVLTHLAKLQNISKDIYEAAEIDGVGWLSKFWRVELPLIGGSIYLLLVFLIIDTVRDAATILALTGFEGGPGGVVTVPALFMIRKAFIDQQMGYACAVGIVLTIVVLLLQRLSTLVTDWEHLSRRARRTWQVIGAIAVALLLLYALRRPLFGTLALATAAAPVLLTRRSSTDPAAQGKPAPDTHSGGPIRPEPPFDPRAEARRRIRARAYGLFLRFAKHGFILSVALLAFVPLVLMLIVSLKDNAQFYEAPAAITHPLHLDNWTSAWEQVYPTLANSLFISTLGTGLTLAFALGAAYFFVRLRMPMSGFFWNAILVLMMMPAIANLVPLFRLLRDLNLLNTLTALILVGAAGGQMFAIFVLRNFVADIPRDMFEAADIDGASHWQQLRTIVAPLSGPILGTVGVMQFVTMWNEFVLPLIVLRDHDHLPVMVQLLRMSGEYVKLWGPLMAGYAIASVPIVVLFVFSMKLFVRGLSEGAVKG